MVLDNMVTFILHYAFLFQRRVLASRANPAVARRLGVSHVRGILLSGPPGCGKVSYICCHFELSTMLHFMIDFTHHEHMRSGWC